MRLRKPLAINETYKSVMILKTAQNQGNAPQLKKTSQDLREYIYFLPCRIAHPGSYQLLQNIGL